MKARFTIGGKLIVGFGILLLVTIINGLFSISSLNENKKVNQEIIEVYNPSVSGLQELITLVNSTQMLAKNWVFIEKQPETPDKQKLIDIIKYDFPKLKEDLTSLSVNWDSTEQAQLNKVLITTQDTLFGYHKQIMDNLSTFESYDDLMVAWETQALVSEGGQVILYTNSILETLDELKNSLNEKAVAANLHMANSFDAFKRVIIVSVLFLVVIVLLTGFFTTRSITEPIYKLREFLLNLSKGILPKEKMVVHNDEVGDMASSLNEFIVSLRETSDFAVAIGKGQYDQNFEPLSEADTLRNALIEMGENLQKTEEDNQKRAEEEQIRNWVTQGLANFGDTLRQNSDNMDKLSSQIMNQLIDYLKVNQGAIYILNENDETAPFFEMKSAIAYNREKYMKVNFELKEGLVGRCAFEKLPVYLKEVPEDYIQLTSGMGTVEPRYLLLVPLIINDVVMGVIEIASFNEIPEYQIDFIKTLGENIASTISNVRINEQTQYLLNESKLRGDELSAQEEELRQNMEELQATQEEATRRENEMSIAIQAINNTLGTIDIDNHGSITSANDNFIELSGRAAGNIVGKSFQEVFALFDNREKEFLSLWSDLHLGQSGTLISNLITSEGEMWLKHTLTPFRNDMGELEKVVDLIIDITEQKRISKELEKAKLNLK